MRLNFKRKNRHADPVHKARLIAHLKARIQIFQEQLDTEDFEGREDESVHITQHIQRVRRVVDDLEKHTQGPGKSRSAM